MSRVIIAGSRNITNQKLLDATVAEALGAWASADFAIETVLSGGAPGVDRLGESWAYRHGIRVQQYMPNWEQFGPQAGPVRNALMAHDADRLILLWDGRSSGSRDMLRQAKRRGLIIWERVESDATT